MTNSKNSPAQTRQMKRVMIIAAVLLASIFVANYVSKNGVSLLKQQPQQEKTDLQSLTSLSIVSDITEQGTIAVGDTATVRVMLDQYPVQAVDVIINYDPEVLSVADVVNGTVFPDLLRTESNDGQIIVSATVDPGNPGNMQTGELFSFVIEGLKPGATSLTFDQDLTITAKDGINTLGNTQQLDVIVE